LSAHLYAISPLWYNSRSHPETTPAGQLIVARSVLD